MSKQTSERYALMGLYGRNWSRIASFDTRKEADQAMDDVQAYRAKVGREAIAMEVIRY